MLICIIAYILVYLLVPPVSVMLTYIPAILLPQVRWWFSVPDSVLMFIMGIANAICSIWLGVLVLYFFQIKAGILLMLIIAYVFSYHYIDAESLNSKLKVSSIITGEMIASVRKQNFSIILGNIWGMAIGWVAIIA